MRILRLEPDDVIIPPFAVIAMTVASQGETIILVLSLFCGESGQPFLTGRISIGPFQGLAILAFELPVKQPFT